MYYLNPRTGKVTRVAYNGENFVVYYSNVDGKEKSVVKWHFKDKIFCEDERELFKQCLKNGVKVK